MHTRVMLLTQDIGSDISSAVARILAYKFSYAKKIFFSVRIYKYYSPPSLGLACIFLNPHIAVAIGIELVNENAKVENPHLNIQKMGDY